MQKYRQMKLSARIKATASSELLNRAQQRGIIAKWMNKRNKNIFNIAYQNIRCIFSLSEFPIRIVGHGLSLSFSTSASISNRIRGYVRCSQPPYDTIEAQPKKSIHNKRPQFMPRVTHPHLAAVRSVHNPPSQK